MNDEQTLATSIAEMKNEIAHVNKHLEKIDLSIDEMRRTIAKQNELQLDVSKVINENSVIKRDLDGLGSRVSDNTKNITELTEMVRDMPKNVKVNIFDYLWKYILIAFGGYIVIQASGLFQAFEKVLD